MNFKRILLTLSLLIGMVSVGYSQTSATLSGTALASGGAPLTSGSVVFTLENCGGAPAFGSAVYNFTLDNSGSISGTLETNSANGCSGTSYYKVASYNSAGALQWSRNYTINTSTFNINTAVPLSTLPTSASGVTIPVSSVFGRTGTIYPSSGDYSVSQISGLLDGTGHINTSILPTIGGSWGAITGSIASQSDLQTALTAKAASGASATINGVTCTLGSTCTVPGTGLTPLGTYSSGTAYVTGNIVTYSGSNYISITGSTGVTPAVGSSWMLLAVAPVAPCAVRTVTTTDTSTTADCLIRDNGTFTETLPTSPTGGESLTIKNIGAGNITIAGGSYLIDGASTSLLSASSFGYQPSVTVVWDSASTTWNIK